MKIYEVSHISEDDTTQHQFFSSKREAEIAHNKLAKIEKAEDEFDSDDFEYKIVKLLFDIKDFEVEISKTGILKMLNNYFSETQ